MTVGPVVVVGDLVTDVVARHAGPVAPHSDTPAQIRIGGGGAGANTAAWLARLGVPVRLVARVGDDDLGARWVAELRDAGVDCAVGTAPGVATGVAVVLVGPDAQRTMLADRGASATLSPDDVAAALHGTAGALHGPAVHLHLSGYTLLDAASRPAGLAALRTARVAGLSVSVDAASAAPLAAAGPAAFLDWVDGVDLLLANAAEAAVLTSGAEPARAAAALVDAARTVVVKDGARGACWHDRTGRDGTGAAAPSAVVDTTGAGDAFAAGLIAAWLAGAAPDRALGAGAALAAEAVAVVGGRPPVSRR